MAITRRLNPLKLLAPLLALGATLLVLHAINGAGAPASGGGAADAATARAGDLPGATTDQRIAGLQAQLRAAPDAEGYAELGLEYLQKVRESGDPSFYARAEGVLREALRVDPGTSRRPAGSARWRSPATTSPPASRWASAPTGSARRSPATTG